MSVLTEPRGSLIAQTKKFFENENVELRFSPAAIEAIAEMAVKRKTGARALKWVLTTWPGSVKTRPPTFYGFVKYFCVFQKYCGESSDECEVRGAWIRCEMRRDY